MSAFKPLGGRQNSALDVRDAYTERKIARMVANGTSPDIARYILENARHARKARKEQRRLTGLRIREHGV